MSAAKQTGHVSAIAAAFVRLMAQRAAPPWERCAVAFIPLRRGRAKPRKDAANIITRKEKRFLHRQCAAGLRIKVTVGSLRLAG